MTNNSSSGWTKPYQCYTGNDGKIVDDGPNVDYNLLIYYGNKTLCWSYNRGIVLGASSQSYFWSLNNPDNKIDEIGTLLARGITLA